MATIIKSGIYASQDSRAGGAPGTLVQRNAKFAHIRFEGNLAADTYTAYAVKLPTGATVLPQASVLRGDAGTTVSDVKLGTPAAAEKFVAKVTPSLPLNGLTAVAASSGAALGEADTDIVLMFTISAANAKFGLTLLLAYIDATP
jgi:hypothetical protein